MKTTQFARLDLPNRKPVRTSGQPDPTRTSIDSLASGGRRHGGGGYGRLFAPIGLLLNKAGYEVVAPDLPGYGLSSKDVSLVNYEVWIRVLNDLVISEHQKSGRPVVLCGGSLGGYLAYLCAASSPLGLIAGLIATTLADPRLDITKKQFAKNWMTSIKKFAQIQTFLDVM